MRKRIDWMRVWEKALLAVAVLSVLAAGLFTVVWYKAFREVPQPEWITADQRNNFLYGSIGSEAEAGIPYWIWLVLPRMFPEYLRDPAATPRWAFLGKKAGRCRRASPK
jgi:hypothetical protein